MHMFGIIAFAQMMVVIGIKLHLELFVGAHEGVDILHGVLHMNVVIACSMNYKDGARQVFGAR